MEDYFCFIPACLSEVSKLQEECKGRKSVAFFEETTLLFPPDLTDF